MGPGIPLSTIFLDESWNTLIFLIFLDESWNTLIFLIFLDGSWNTLILKILQSIEKQDKSTLQVTLLFFLYISKLQNYLVKKKLRNLSLSLVISTVISSIKGSDRLCKVGELSMQCCGKLLSDSFRHTGCPTSYQTVISSKLRFSGIIRKFNQNKSI